MQKLKQTLMDHIGPEVMADLRAHRQSATRIGVMSLVSVGCLLVLAVDYWLG